MIYWYTNFGMLYTLKRKIQYYKVMYLQSYVLSNDTTCSFYKHFFPQLSCEPDTCTYMPWFNWYTDFPSIYTSALFVIQKYLYYQRSELCTLCYFTIKIILYIIALLIKIIKNYTTSMYSWSVKKCEQLGCLICNHYRTCFNRLCIKRHLLYFKFGVTDTQKSS